MVDVFSKAKRSAVMSRIRSHGNAETELALIRIFRTYNIVGWRRHWPLVGRPDFVFPRQRLAVFVDGCFWHGCKIHGTQPSSNQVYWLQKLQNNKTRDRLVNRELRKQGWIVLRVWHHELSQKNHLQVVQRIQRHLTSYSASLETTKGSRPISKITNALGSNLFT